MKDKQEYDFFTMGFRDAKNSMESCYQRAVKIEEQYGADARMEYEVGIALTIPQYERFSVCKEETKKNTENATKNFGVDNTRNNSYFGSTGTSKQYVTGPDGMPMYNEPNMEPKK